MNNIFVSWGERLKTRGDLLLIRSKQKLPTAPSLKCKNNTYGYHFNCNIVVNCRDKVVLHCCQKIANQNVVAMGLQLIKFR